MPRKWKPLNPHLRQVDLTQDKELVGLVKEWLLRRRRREAESRATKGGA